MAPPERHNACRYAAPVPSMPNLRTVVRRLADRTDALGDALLPLRDSIDERVSAEGTRLQRVAVALVPALVIAFGFLVADLPMLPGVPPGGFGMPDERGDVQGSQQGPSPSANRSTETLLRDGAAEGTRRSGAVDQDVRIEPLADAGDATSDGATTPGDAASRDDDAAVLPPGLGGPAEPISPPTTVATQPDPTPTPADPGPVPQLPGPTPVPTAPPTFEPTPELTPAPTPTPTPTQEPTPEPTQEPTPEPTPLPEPTPTLCLDPLDPICAILP
jgi:hypothetical protein